MTVDQAERIIELLSALAVANALVLVMAITTCVVVLQKVRK